MFHKVSHFVDLFSLKGRFTSKSIIQVLYFLAATLFSHPNCVVEILAAEMSAQRVKNKKILENLEN